MKNALEIKLPLNPDFDKKVGHDIKVINDGKTIAQFNICGAKDNIIDDINELLPYMGLGNYKTSSNKP